MADLHPLGFLSLMGRLLLAMGLGAALGWERETVDKPAGLRTNILVCLGAAALILGMIQSGVAQASTDALSRAIQGVVTGVGFVGAGSIFRGDRTHGLTSAATVWVSAALGISIALGQWQLSILLTVLTLFTLRVLKVLE